MTACDVLHAPPRRAALLFAGFLLANLVTLVAAQPATRPTNDRCPVTPEEASSPLHEISFRGERVRFCCGQCKSRFLLEPQAYLARLPHVPAEQPATDRTSGGDHGRPTTDYWKLMRRAELFVNAWQPYMIGIVVAGLVHLYAAGRVRRRLKGEVEASVPPRRTLPTRLLDALARPSTLLIAVLVLALLANWSRPHVPASPAFAARPPDSFRDTAARFAADMARQGVLQGPEFVALLDKTYYRGNDERSETLFNGGIYRTCTFDISLRTEDGEPVAPGQNVHGRRLFVRVEIRRAPRTLENHFTDASMTNNCLIARGVLPDTDAQGVSDAAHPLLTLEPGSRWAAGCPIAQVTSETTLQRFDGMVFLGPAPGAGGNAEQAWPGAHYGIQYSLRVEHGVLTASSKLWMGALLFTEDLPDHRLYEWLSWRPLPEIPADFRHVSETD